MIGCDEGYVECVEMAQENRQTVKEIPLTSSNSVDSGIDVTDGYAVLASAPQVQKSSCPSQQLTHLLHDEEMEDSTPTRITSRNDKRRDRNDLLTKVSSLVKKLKSLNVLYCVGHQNKVERKSEVFIRDKHAKSKEEERVELGMKLSSVSDNDTTRHFIHAVQDEGVAHQLTLSAGDELLMVNDQVVVNMSHAYTLDYFFYKLPENKPLTLATRRAMGDCDGHMIYEYFILTGTIQILEDDEIKPEIAFTVDASFVGIGDLIDIKPLGRDLRSIRSVEDNATIRIRHGQLVLDARDTSHFDFDVLRYSAFDTSTYSSVLVWILRHADDSACYLVNKSSRTDVQLIKETKASIEETKWSAFTENGIKWLTRNMEDSSDKHMFQSLTDPGMFWRKSNRGLQCIHKRDWHDAEKDYTTHFHVTPSVR